MSNPGEQPDESKRLCNGTECSYCPDLREHASNRGDNLEHRKYHGHAPYYYPKMKVLAKTPSGHMILFDDRESSACIRVVDSSGQEIILESNRKIQITDRAGSAIIMDGESGDITIRSAGRMLLNP